MGGWAGWHRTALAFGAGAAIATGQAPVGAWWLAVPALAALFWLVSRPGGARQAAWTAWFGGAGHFMVALSWLVEPFLIDVDRYGWMAPFAVVLMGFGLALFWAAAGAIAGRSRQPVPVFAVGLAAAELARGYVMTGFPWASIGHIWIDTPTAQLAAWVGPSGLTLLTTLAAACAVGLRPVRLTISAALLAAAWGFGAWVLVQPNPAPPGVILRLVQPNAEQHMKWDADLASVYFDRQLAYTAVKPTPDLVIWPETALPYLLERSPEVAGIVAQAAGGAPVALGLQRIDGDRSYNSMAVIGAGGEVSARYDKHHLVPFGEYIPFGDLAFRWFGVAAFAAQQGNGYSQGSGPAVIDLGGKLGKVVPLICYEAVFPQDLRTDERPDWILQITNDAWFGTLTGPFQHAAQARLRAIEQGLPLVRVANTGVTAVYDARGRVTAELDFGIAGYIDTALPGPLSATLYARRGEIPVLVLLGALFLALVWRGRRAAG